MTTNSKNINNEIKNVHQRSLYNTLENSLCGLTELPKSTSIRLTEHFNSKKLKILLKHPDILEKNKTLLDKYFKNSNTGTKETVFRPTYHGYGRLYAERGLSLQSFSKRIRHTLAQDIYYDIDIVNAHPVILAQLCRELNYNCPNLKNYVKKRDDYINELTNTLNIDKSTVKLIFISLIYGSSIDNIKQEYNITDELPKFVKLFKIEITKIANLFYNHFTTIKAIINKSKRADCKNKKSSVLSVVIQVYENIILNHIVDFFNINNYQTDVLVFDGCMVRKTKELPLSVLRKCENYVKEKTSFIISLHEKPMDNPYILNEISEEFIDEHSAAKAFLELYGKDKIKFCDGELFVFNDKIGMWMSNYYDIHNLAHAYISKFGEWITVNKKFKQMLESLKSLCIDKSFLINFELSSLGKLLFKNGYYDFEEKKFHCNFTPLIFFPFRIERDFPKHKNEDDIKKVNKILFEDPFDKPELGEFLKMSLARTLAGCIGDKKFFVCVGETNAGKGVLCDALFNTFGKYIGSFNGSNLTCQGQAQSTEDSLRNKEWLANRYCRLIYSNEISMEKKLDGNRLKMVSSGGDVMVARNLYQSNISFIPNFTAFLMVNDLPNITPVDDAVKERIRVIEFNKRFSTSPKKGEMKADPLLKSVLIKSKWFQDALLHILINSFQDKQIDFKHVINSTKEWTETVDDFKTVFLANFEITNNDKDILSNSDIEIFIKDMNLKISKIKVSRILTKMGLEKYKSGNKRGFIGVKNI